jgi:ribosome-associated protein
MAADPLDLVLRDGRRIPEAELDWDFARAGGPGGQGVNTTDSAVRLVWDYAGSAVLRDGEAALLAGRLGHRARGGRLVVTAREHRSQWANRRAAVHRLVQLVDRALAPPGPVRRATRATRAAQHRRLQAKRVRSTTKQGRRTPQAEDG